MASEVKFYKGGKKRTRAKYVLAPDRVAVIVKLISVSGERPPDGEIVASLRPLQREIAKTLGVAVNDRALRWEFDHVETETCAEGVAVLLREDKHLCMRGWFTKLPSPDEVLTPELEAAILMHSDKGICRKQVARLTKSSPQMVSYVRSKRRLYASKLFSPEEIDQILKGTRGEGQ